MNMKALGAMILYILLISLYIFAEAQGNYTLWVRGLSPALPNDTVRVCMPGMAR